MFVSLVKEDGAMTWCRSNSARAIVITLYWQLHFTGSESLLLTLLHVMCSLNTPFVGTIHDYQWNRNGDTFFIFYALNLKGAFCGLWKLCTGTSTASHDSLVIAVTMGIIRPTHYCRILASIILRKIWSVHLSASIIWIICFKNTFLVNCSKINANITPNSIWLACSKSPVLESSACSSSIKKYWIVQFHFQTST